jgi:hypothetical protein
MGMKAKRLTDLALAILLCSSIAILLPTQTVAQSGRRLPKLPPKSTEPPPAKEPPAEETPAARSKEKAPLATISVVYQYDSFMGSNIYTNAALTGCLNRLQKALGVEARFGNEMNRKEASDAAKASTDLYVLWFQLESESFRQDSGRGSSQSYYINYVLFAPATGKGKSSGHVYQRQRGAIPMPRGDMGAEYNLKNAGSEMADRVLGALNLPLPPDRY